MDSIIQNIIGGASLFGVGLITGYIICKVGLTNLVHDVENLKNLKIQNPLTVSATPVASTVVAKVPD
jgi:hypothetical protein